MSRRLQVLLVQVDVHGCVRLGGVGPQLGGVEAHPVGRVEHLLVPVRLELGNRDDGLDSHDHTPPAPRAPPATATVRASHSPWNVGSSGSTSTGPNPCMPPRSWTPSTPSSFHRRRAHQGVGATPSGVYA